MRSSILAVVRWPVGGIRTYLRDVYHRRIRSDTISRSSDPLLSALEFKPLAVA